MRGSSGTHEVMVLNAGEGKVEGLRVQGLLEKAKGI